MRTYRTGALSLGVAIALAGGITGTAQADQPNVVTAIKAQDKIMKQSPALKKINNLNGTSKAQARKLVADLGKLEKLSEHAVSVVAKASTSDAKQRQGKQDWLKGTREQNRGLLQLRTALKSAIAGNKTAFKGEYTKALKTLISGAQLSAKGDKLLGLPTND